MKMDDISQALSVLGSDRDLNIVRRVAGNPKTPSEVLHKIVKRYASKFLFGGYGKNHDSVSSILAGVAHNPNTQTKTLDIISKSDNWSALAGVIKNELASKEAIEICTKYFCDKASELISGSAYTYPILLQLVNHPNTTKTSLEYIVKGAPQQKIRSFAQAKLDKLSHSIKESKDMSDHQKTLDRLAKERNSDIKDIIARNKAVHPNTLRRLSKSRDTALRGVIAYSEHTNPEILAMLSKDHSAMVRQNVAVNLNTSEETLEHLSKDPSPQVRVRVAYNKNVPLSILKTLSNDPSAGVQLAVTHNRKTTTEILYNILTNSTKWPENFNMAVLYDNLAHHHNSDEELLRKMGSFAVPHAFRSASDALKVRFGVKIPHPIWGDDYE